MEKKTNPWAAEQESLNLLKSDINLIEFACHKFNYLPDWEHPIIKANRQEIKSSPNSIKLIHKENTLDSIIITRNGQNQNYVYKSLCNTDDKGTIYDFVKYRVKDFSISKLRKMCKNYQQGKAKGFFPDIDLRSRRGANMQGNSDKPSIDRFKFYLKPFDDKSYLLNRGLNSKVIDKHFKFAYNLPETNGSTSLVVPYYNFEKNQEQKDVLSLHTYQKYSEVNEVKKQFLAGGKANSIWVSSVDKTIPITAIVISESPVDSASFAELRPQACGKNPLLTASGGEYGVMLSDTYRKVIDSCDVKEVILANDNDCKGQRYNAQILASLPIQRFVEPEFLEKNKGLLEANVSLGVSDYKGFLEWQFSHQKFKQDERTLTDQFYDVLPVFTAVKDYYFQENHELKMVNEGKDVFKITPEFGVNSSKLKLEFHNTKDNWDSINESLKFLRFGYSDQITIEKSICKDWNNDLKIVKGIDLKPISEDKELLKEFVDRKLISAEKAVSLEKKLEQGMKKSKGVSL